MRDINAKLQSHGENQKIKMKISVDLALFFGIQQPNKPPKAPLPGYETSFKTQLTEALERYKIFE